MSNEKVLEFVAAVWTLAVVFAPFGEALAADHPEAQVARKTSFEAFLSSGLEELAPYAKMPNEKDALPNKKYTEVVEEVDWEVRQALVPECLPDEKFVQENLQLIPAKHRKEEEDTAFLSYETGGKTFMVVQTGGEIFGEIWVFIRSPAVEKVASPEDAAARARTVLDKYFTKRVRRLFPPPAFKKTGKMYVGEVKATNAINPKPFLRGTFFITDTEVCLTFRKSNLADAGGTSGQPAPDEWFNWRKGDKK
jgi:hypothetical protein